MADFTPNYNLKKPLRTEYYNVADANGNSDIVDTQLKAVNDRVDLVEGEVDALESGKVDKVVGKQLSDENYTLIEKNKVANLPDDTNAQLADKANKTQEPWISPTLINGASNYGAPYNNLTYRKNQFGNLQITGTIAVVPSGTTIFVLPTGYRPVTTKNVTGVTGGAVRALGVGIFANGNVTVYGTATGYISIECTIPLEV